MPIGITEDHLALHEAVRGWIERSCPPAVPRAFLDAAVEDLPPFWSALAEQGWLGLHVSEAYGGSGYTAAETVVVVEELARACAPGPALATLMASAVIGASTNGDAREALLPGLADGSVVGALAAGGAGHLTGTRSADGLQVSGTLRPVLSGHLAGVIVAAIVIEGEPDLAWIALDVGAGVAATELPSVDLTRRVAEVVVDAAVPDARVLANVSHLVPDLAAVLLAAELVGVAQWCVETAAEYAKDRVQFGRPIGQFQAVKHKCADMLGRVELARAAAWDAAREADGSGSASLAASAALALALEAAFDNAKDCVQIHGGIGFTWEHDAHVYLRRSMALRSLAGEPDSWHARAGRHALAGDRRSLSIDLGEDADAIREQLRAFLAEVVDLEPIEQRRRVADAGYLTPTWPPPWGRSARRAVEQLVIDQEFRAAKVPRPSIVIGAWALPPVIMYGTPEQQERWIPPTLHGELAWCQLFSEPGAGSDLAALTTRATKVEGGWFVNGQKVWTSMAKQADWGILLARTNPEAPKHDGISCFMLDMKTPGIDIRPLRELTGDAFFNEVFFNDVFIPDDCLVGEEHDGWRAARTILANERVAMGGGVTLGHGLEQILKLVATAGLTDDERVLAEVGSLVTSAHALSCLGFRLTLAALSGADPSGSEAAVRKLLGVLHDQRVQEVGLHLAGAEGAVAAGDAGEWSRGFLFNRNLTIAGGTSEIQRNIIGERVLGLPRDP